MIKSKAKPFLKWAGGKKQLLAEFDKRFPNELNTGEIRRYVEPFVGGGAVFFYIAQKFSFKECYIFDINEELILTYKVVKKDVDDLIEILKTLESGFLKLNTKERESFYYAVRGRFNDNKDRLDFNRYNCNNWIERAAQIIFLNKTCFNGLFRVNSNGEFNVPFGKYKSPTILNENNLRKASRILRNTQIEIGDFTECERFINNHTFVYLDPPYRPLNQTSSFTSYSKTSFTEKDQIRLAKFYETLNANGAKLMLSNSDPKNEKPDDNFLDQLYSDFKIERVPARRAINCNGEKRGAISELIITNYNID